MPTQNRFLFSALTGLLLATAAGLAYAAASEAEAAGVNLAEALEASADGTSDSGTAPEVRRSQIQLVLDRDGSAERLELADLHEMAIGESRSLTTQSGTPVVVTRDEDGFEIDLDGKKIRLLDHFSTSGLPDAEAGGTNVMILRNKVARDENGAAIGGGSGAGEKVVVMRRSPGGDADAHGFAFTTGTSAAGELPAIPLPVEATIRRLEASATFQELDAATRAKVVEALRETAPKARAIVAGEPGERTIVLEIEEQEDTAAGTN